jgi:hypothetical protein
MSKVSKFIIRALASFFGWVAYQLKSAYKDVGCLLPLSDVALIAFIIYLIILAIQYN